MKVFIPVEGYHHRRYEELCFARIIRLKPARYGVRDPSIGPVKWALRRFAVNFEWDPVLLGYDIFLANFPSPELPPSCNQPR